MPQSRIFLKKLSLIFLGILPPGKILVLELWAKILSVNQIAGFFNMWYLKKKVNDEVCFWLADKNQSFLQVDIIILGVANQASSKYPK